METIFLFCADAGAGADGRLNIHGIFNELYALDFPARQDRIVLAGIVEWQRDLQGRIPFKMDLADPAGLSIFTIDGHTDIEHQPSSRSPAKTQFILPMANVMFPASGCYQMRIDFDGNKIAGPSMYLILRSDGNS
jgi:hypothetical protein